MLHGCVDMRETIKLSFGVVSVVSPGIGVLDGGQGAGTGRGFREFSPPLT